MKYITTLQEFWDQYIVPTNQQGFNTWTIVWMYQLPEEKRGKLPENLRQHRVMPTIVTIADPITRKASTVCITEDAPDVMKILQQNYLKMLPAEYKRRMGGYFPGKSRASLLYEYEKWQDFKDDWLVRDGMMLAPYNFSLMFDIPSELEYLDWEHRKLCKIEYPRLIVTLYQHKTGKFHDLLIKNVTKADIEHYLEHLSAHAELHNLWV